MKSRLKAFLKEHFFDLWLLGKCLSHMKWRNYPRRIFGLIKNYNTYKNHKKSIFIISTPEYGNLGDHAIALAEIEFAKKYFGDYEIVAIPDSKFNENILALKLFHNHNDLIFLIGGGNFGNKYKLVEFVRIDVVKECKKCKIVMFPQTYNFTDDAYDKYYLDKNKAVYGDSDRILLMFREEQSYIKASKMFNNISLVPDVVMTWELPALFERKNNAENYIGLCFRNDDEKVVDNIQIEEIRKVLNNIGKMYQEFDTDLGPIFLDTKHSRDNVYKILEKISDCSLLITDRLHGMIFAYITGTPCLFMDNYNKKLTGVYEKWINTPEIIPFNPEMGVEEQVVSMISMSDYRIDTDYYGELIYNSIKKFIS